VAASWYARATLPGHVLRPHRLIDPDRVVARQALQPPGQERLEREVAAVLLADEHDDRRAVLARRGERGDRVAEPRRRVQQRQRRRAARDGVAGGHRDRRALVQREHELEVVGQPGEERHLGRAGVREDRRQLEATQHIERHGPHGVLAGHGGRILQNVWTFVIPYPARMATVRPRPGGQVLHNATGASEQIAAQIRVWLEQQQLTAGERIGTEQELADDFGVSRPTMREALRLLSAAHLIRVGRGRSGGIFVARTPSEGMSRNLSESIALMLSAQSISMAELLDARLSLEVPIAGRAAVNADAGVVARLEQAIADAVGHQPGTEPFNTADSTFHAVLAEASGNQLLFALTGWILEVLQPTLVVKISPRVDADAILAQHRAILRAVRRNQRLAAEKAMAAHIEYLVQILDEGE
jgi:GntR family transcriptional repressor for pyruvate dehydrogenase complex